MVKYAVRNYWALAFEYVACFAVGVVIGYWVIPANTNPMDDHILISICALVFITGFLTGWKCK